MFKNLISEISFTGLKEVYTVVLPAQRRAMTGAVRTPFRDKTWKALQAYSRVEPSQLSMVDWIFLIVHTVYVILFIVLSYDIASTSLFQPFRITYLK